MLIILFVSILDIITSTSFESLLNQMLKIIFLLGDHPDNRSSFAAFPVSFHLKLGRLIKRYIHGGLNYPPWMYPHFYKNTSLFISNLKPDFQSHHSD